MSELLGVLITLLFIIFQKSVKTGLKKGLEISVLSLLPSLFPYMLISGIFLKSGGVDIVSDIVYTIFGKFLKLSKKSCGGYVLSLFCGYPTGARISSELSEDNEISKKEALRLFLAGNIPGFGYCASFLNAKYGNGLKIYFSYVIASLILNYIYSFFLKSEIDISKTKNTILPFYKAVTESVKSACLSMLNLCGFVCFFSCISEILNQITNNKKLYSIINSFLEISSGAETVSQYFKTEEALYITVFFTGFCGLSVIFQSLSFKKGAINIKLLLLTRFLFGLLSLFIFILLKGIQI